jgi:nucleotide-binding universal stress UspA family protein
MNFSKVVVGVDDSEQSRAALQWAAKEAALRNIEMHVVHVYDWRVVGASSQVGGPYAEGARVRAEALVESAVIDARTFAPDVNVSGQALLGSPGSSLVRASESDSLVVLGNRGRGGFSSLLLGSVSQQVGTHASGPVVVVRGRTGIEGGPVVVGVDGSPGSEFALGVAFDAAAARGTNLVAVRAYSMAPPPWGPDSPPFIENVEERRAEERQMVADQVGPWMEKYPDIPAETMAVVGHPAEVLGDLSSTAQLVVVGTRGHGGFAGLLLGSVGLQLLHHADSPVLVVRAGNDTAR